MTGPPGPGARPGEIVTTGHADETLARRLAKAGNTGPWMLPVAATLLCAIGGFTLYALFGIGHAAVTTRIIVAAGFAVALSGALLGVFLFKGFGRYWATKVPPGTRLEGRFSHDWVGVALGSHTQTLERARITRVYVRDGIFVLVARPSKKSMFVPAELVPPFVARELLRD